MVGVDDSSKELCGEETERKGVVPEGTHGREGDWGRTRNGKGLGH